MKKNRRDYAKSISIKKQSLSVKNAGYSEGGASREKNTLKTWYPSHYSAKSDIDANLSTLRDRAADLVMNSPIGAAAINSSLAGVISSGLKLFPRVNKQALQISDEEAHLWTRKVKQEFEFWSKSLDCDFYRRNNFDELQQIAYMSYLTDGDCFCLFRRKMPKLEMPYSLKLQLIEAGRVSNPITNSKLTGGILSLVEMEGISKDSRIINGVEVDKDGVLQAIWVSNRVYNEPLSKNGELKWQRVKFFGDKSGIRNILHICADTRTEQFRGVPYLAPIIETIKQVTRYADAELTSAIIKSFFSIFFVQLIGENNFSLDKILNINEGEPIVDVSEYKLGPGSISALPRGVDVKSIDATNAQSTFDPFVNQFVQQCGAALGLPYEVLMKKFQSSYSASRAALLQAESEFRRRRAAFVNDFCQPIYEAWLSEAVFLGRIDAPKFFDNPLIRAAWCGADWHVEGSHMLDVQKEVEGAKMRIELGLSTHEKEAAELCGTDFFENLEVLQSEINTKKKYIE